MNLAMKTAAEFCTMPSCKNCKEKAVLEHICTESFSYTAGVRVKCPKCGRFSEWFYYDNYSCDIPSLWDVLRMVFADFNEKE